MITRLAALVAVLVASVAVIVFGISQSSQAGHPSASKAPVKKVTICHFTSENASHPYNEISIDAKQIVNGNGHGGHVFDIWPSFQFELKDGTVVTVPAHGDQSILNAHCTIPGETETATPTETTGTPTQPGGPFVPSTDCPPANLFNAIRGTRKDDHLVGTPCQDVMAGHNGNDTLFGAAESDIIFGGRGKDTINGGTGRDSLRGGFNDDRINAVDGAPGDRVIGGVGRDVCTIDQGDRVRQCERVRVR